EGEIKTTKLAIEPNALFTGTCQMSTQDKQFTDEQ
ncbi:MAG: polymer-forming cytoskeletal protein, partial [Bacteroidales bacterium]|nr:polymer-forming cytoskeletal protein [Bacteroidales bacterium]